MRGCSPASRNCSTSSCRSRSTHRGDDDRQVDVSAQHELQPHHGDEEALRRAAGPARDGAALWQSRRDGIEPLPRSLHAFAHRQDRRLCGDDEDRPAPPRSARHHAQPARQDRGHAAHRGDARRLRHGQHQLQHHADGGLFPPRRGDDAAQYRGRGPVPVRRQQHREQAGGLGQRRDERRERPRRLPHHRRRAQAGRSRRLPASAASPSAHRQRMRSRSPRTGRIPSASS